MRFNVQQVKINEFYQLYDDLINSIAASLTELGHSCTVKINTYSNDAINILLGSTIFASRYQNLPTALRGMPYIVYQLEQLDDTRGLLSEWPEYWTLLRNAAAVWDYSPASTAFLQKKGLGNVTYIPPAFHRTLECFRPRPKQDIDVLFFGSPHPRRNALMETLRTQGLNVAYLTSVFGDARNRYIERAKVVLNVHAWDDLLQLETVRLSFLLANRACVVSELSDHNPYGDGVAYARYDELADLCVRYARAEPSAREALAEAGYLAVRKIDMVKILRDALDATPDHRLQTLSGPFEIVTDRAPPSPRDEILPIVPVGARRILDVGCAGGEVGANLKRRQSCHVTGIEIDPATAQRAARTLDTVLVGDAVAVLPSLEDLRYDCILMLDVLGCVTDPAALLRMAAKKLEAAGTLILSVYNIAHWTTIQSLLEGRWDYGDDGVLGRANLRFFTLGSLARLLQEAGFLITGQGATQLNMGPRPEGLFNFARMNGPANFDAELNLQTFQNILACQKI